MVLSKNSIVVFDLDDTLYKEIDFLKSAFNEISIHLSSKIKIESVLILDAMMNYYNNGLNVFDEVIKTFNIDTVSIDQLLTIYRNHKPVIELCKSTKKALWSIKKRAYRVGIITDGRSIQQRNKISALQLTDYFDDIIISEEFGSEKPHINNFGFFINKYGTNYEYVYIGDNTAKDFIGPNALGWASICLLDDGRNIHKQFFNSDKITKPLYLINDLNEIKNILQKT
ncbi:HAD family hydrolase [Mariniflexile sp.]|uniref:HAD family hydrolase n=1 Tax=Mariniflexile sp. TaxID=1979402 RepID=UPI004048618D